jgi:carboxyl-terminal processing protease
MRTSKLIAIGIVLGFAAIPLVAIPASLTLSYLELIAGIMQEVQRDYVHPVQVDVLAKNALKGMLTRLDPHSDYLDEQEYIARRRPTSVESSAVSASKSQLRMVFPR